jgi:hypothetical protein
VVTWCQSVAALNWAERWNGCMWSVLCSGNVAVLPSMAEPHHLDVSLPAPTLPNPHTPCSAPRFQQHRGAGITGRRSIAASGAAADAATQDHEQDQVGVGGGVSV